MLAMFGGPRPYIQTLIGPDECPTCQAVFDVLWELRSGRTDEVLKKACPPCALKEGWA